MFQQISTSTLWYNHGNIVNNTIASLERKAKNMKFTAERTVDELGRVVLPPDMRKEMNLEAGEKVLISCENGELKIIKAKPRCKLCGADMSEDDQFVICLRCIDDIRSTK